MSLFLICIFSDKSAISNSKFKAFGNPTNTQQNYDQAKAQLDAYNAEYNQIMQKAQTIEAELSAATEQAFVVQDEYLKKQENLRNLAIYEYKHSTIFSLLACIIDSDNFDDVLKNMDYSNSVMDFHNQSVKEQKLKKEEFDSALANLNKKSEELNAQLGLASSKMQEAQQVFDQASAVLDAEQVSKLKKDVPSGGSGNVPIPSPGPTPAPSPVPIPPGPSWSSGTASAYGGSSDPHTPNPGRTATGEICDDWSMGVAVPMSWPGYRSYFHHAIQICYNGMTILAKVNDCGYMGGGSRCLDLQPGVFKAFGFSTCQSWGLRRVEYSIL